MNSDKHLLMASVLSIALTSVHFADDIVRGFEPGGLGNLRGIAILVVWLYAAVRLNGTRVGYALLILGSLLALVIPATHMSGAGLGGKVAASEGAVFFIATLLAVGVTGGFSFILAVQGLWQAWHRKVAG